MTPVFSIICHMRHKSPTKENKACRNKEIVLCHTGWDPCGTAGWHPAAPNKASAGLLLHMATDKIRTTNVLSLPLAAWIPLSGSFFLSFFVINLSLFLTHCLHSSLLLLPWTHHHTIPSMSPSCMVPAINVTTPFLRISVSLWRCGAGSRAW